MLGEEKQRRTLVFVTEREPFGVCVGLPLFFFFAAELGMLVLISPLPRQKLSSA